MLHQENDPDIINARSFQVCPAPILRALKKGDLSEMKICFQGNQRNNYDLILLARCRYEFTTPSGEHVTMSAAAAKGKVFVCGGSAVPGKWEQTSKPLAEGVKSFRLKEVTRPAA